MTSVVNGQSGAETMLADRELPSLEQVRHRIVDLVKAFGDADERGGLLITDVTPAYRTQYGESLQFRPFGYLKLSPDMFWPAILVATAGNTVGGAISYAMGLGAEKAVERWKEHHPHAPTERRMRGRWHHRAHDWIHRMGPPALLLSWLPAVGDPLCAVAGWLRLPFWPCVAYMAIGKFLRYLVMTAGLLWLFPGQV